MDFKTLRFTQDRDADFTYYYPIAGDDQTYIAISNRNGIAHIQVDAPMAGKGLATIMIKAFAYREGPITFSLGRITNPAVNHIIDKLRNDNEVTVDDEDDDRVVIEA